MMITSGVPFIGRVPLDPALMAACEAGGSYGATATAGSGKQNVLQKVVDHLLR